MNDYRYTLVQDLEQKIEETKSLLEDPAMAELAQLEIADLEAQKTELEEGIQSSQQKQEDNFDDKNIILELKGAAGGDEAKLWAEELIRMYTRFAQRKGFQVDILDDYVIKISGHGAF